MSEFKGTYLEKLVNKKAEKDNSIDLNAYALGIKDSKAPEMLEMLQKVLKRLPQETDADINIYYEAKQLIKQATEL